MSIEERLARVEKILDARGLDWDHPRVANEPAKKWRILEPGEVVQEGDRVNAKINPPSDPPNGLGWIDAPSFYFGKEVSVGFHAYFARPVADHPPPAKPKRWRILGDKEIIQAGEWYNAKVNKPGKWPPHGGWVQLEDNDISMLGLPAGNFPDVLWCREVTDDIEAPKPAWEPKVGDWVKLTRPEDWKACKNPEWVPAMHQYHGQVMKVSQFEQRYGAWVATFEGTDWFFNRDWISPAEPPEPEYRKPVLPADAGKECEFSIDGNEWTEGKLRGYAGCFWQSAFGELVGVKWWNHCRIKKDA
jgi:hypothetical protein